MWCVDLIASCVGCGGAVAGKQQVHQLTVLNLHTYHVHDNRLKMPGKQGCVWRAQHIQMTQTGTSRHWQAVA